LLVLAVVRNDAYVLPYFTIPYSAKTAKHIVEILHHAVVTLFLLF